MHELAISADGMQILGSPSRGVRQVGAVVKPGGFQGWQGLPAGRREALARAGGHGEHDVPTFLPARVVTVDAWVLADSASALGHLGDSLVSIGATGDRFRFSVSMYGETRWAYARRISAEFDDSGARRGDYRGEFQLQVVCADPRKYGEIREFPSRGFPVPVFHQGNFSAFPEIEVREAPSSYSVTSPGGTFTVSGATSGGTHVIDMRTGRVFRNGVEQFDVGRGDLWSVPRGAVWEHTVSAPGVIRIPDTDI